VSAVFSIVCSKPLRQEWLLEERDIDAVDPQKDERPAQMRTGQQYQRLAEEDQNHAGDHRIADVSVGSSDHQPPWRIPWGQRAVALGDEAAERGGKQESADRQEA
jgi:hypothetical protein